jgi:hypothetical protein
VSGSPVRGATGALLWLLLLAGCGGSGPGTPEAPEGTDTPAVGGDIPARAAPLDPLALLPEHAFAVVDVDVASLKASPHADQLLSWLAGTLEDMVHEQRARELLQQTDHLLLGLVAPADDDEDAEPGMVLVVRGHLDGDQLPHLLPDGSTVERDPATGRTIRLLYPEFAAAVIDDETWLFTTPALMAPALQRAEGVVRGRGPLTDPALAAMADRVGFGGASVTAVAHVLPDLRAEIGDDRYFTRANAEAMRVLGVRLELERGLDVELVADTTDAASARALAARTLELTRWASSHAIVGLLGLSPLFKGVRARSDGPQAVLMLHLDDAYVAQLLSRAEALVGRLGTLGSEGGGAAVGGNDRP